jgi:hypothetical protein
MAVPGCTIGIGMKNYRVSLFVTPKRDRQTNRNGFILTFHDYREFLINELTV